MVGPQDALGLFWREHELLGRVGPCKLLGKFGKIHDQKVDRLLGTNDGLEGVARGGVPNRVALGIGGAQRVEADAVTLGEVLHARRLRLRLAFGHQLHLPA